jgi:hypothetical protein
MVSSDKILCEGKLLFTSFVLLMSSFSVVDAKGEKFRDQSNGNYIKHQTPNTTNFKISYLQMVF